MTPPGGGAAPHPVTGIDDLVHQRVRLGVLAITAESPAVEVVYLREALQLTAGNLSRHLAALADAGLVRQDRPPAGPGARPRTRVRITAAGRAALRREVAALRAIVEQLDGTA